MAVLTSGFSALGTLTPEANPALAGQSLYTDGAKGNLNSLMVMDKQIFRLLGKAISLAASSYRVRQGRPFNRPRPDLGYAEQFL
jgi:citrate synthase